MIIDLHRLGQLRSIALHREVLSALESDASVLERARRKLAQWEHEEKIHPVWAARWHELLDGPPAALAERLVADDDEAATLRSCTPFTGVVGPRERWAIWARVRAEVEAQEADSH